MIFKMCRSVLTFTKNTQERTGVPIMPESTLWMGLKARGDDTVTLDSFLQWFIEDGLTTSVSTAGGYLEEGNGRQM